MKKFFIALQFLTILPIKITSRIKNADFGKSLIYFPVIGTLIGVFLTACLFLFSFLPDIVISILILIILSIITGGIHLDGFADTCDGFCGSKSKERILEIMRDSRIGVMGVIGLVNLLILKFSLILSIPEQVLPKSLILMTTFSRWSQVLSCYTSRYARKEGKAKYFIEYDSKWEFLAGSIFTIVIFLFLMQLKGMIILVISTIVILLAINYVKNKIDGMTGDTIGAISEVAEISILFFTLLWWDKQILG